MTQEATCAVYEIRNRVNGKRYIGATSNVTKRFRNWRWHIGSEKGNKYLPINMRHDVLTHGASSFDLVVLEETATEELAEQREFELISEASEDELYNRAVRGPYKPRSELVVDGQNHCRCGASTPASFSECTSCATKRPRRISSGEAHQAKMASDPEYAERTRKRKRENEAKRRKNPEILKKQRDRKRADYQARKNDPEFLARKIEAMKKYLDKLKQDPEGWAARKESLRVAQRERRRKKREET